MKRKELMKRTLALSLSAIMALGNIPATTYASENVQTEEEAIQTEELSQEEAADDGELITPDESEDSIQEDQDILQEQQGDEAEAQVLEPEEEPEASVEVQTAEQGFQVMTADDGEADASEKTAEQTAAEEYLKEHYIDGTITANGTKSEDGLTYTIGLKTPSGNTLRRFGLTYESADSNYVTGWYIDKNEYLSDKEPAKNARISIVKRPTQPYTFKATLKLFAKGTEESTINDGTATALASQDFTFILEAEEAETNYTMTVNVQDEEGKAIKDAAVTLEKNGSKVSPKDDGSYDMEKGADYTLTVKKEGYNDYRESVSSFNPTEVNTVKTVTLKKIVRRNIKFNVTDRSGNPVKGATVTVKRSWDEKITPESDGSYNLIDGISYTYEVEAKNYKNIYDRYFTPEKDETIEVQLEKDISEYTVSINPVDNAGKAIENPSIKVTYEEEDPWDEEETITGELKANSDGTYTMKKGVTYTYTVTAPDYKGVTGTYTPSGDDEKTTLNVKMVSSIDPADVETVNAVKEKFDKETGVLRPNFEKDKNILDLVKSKIDGYTDIDTTGVTVSVKSSDAVDWVAADGSIHYRAQEPDQWGLNLKNVGLVFEFEKNGAKAETESHNATIGWNREYFNTQMETDQKSLTWDKIKGTNTDAAEVTSNLTLPQCLSTSAKTAWTKITWTSSNKDVISFKDTGWGTLIDAKEGVITRQPEDTEVILTATFNANENLLNTNVEKLSDFATLTKEFKVTVKGTGETKPTEKELLAILDKYYTTDRITEFGSDGKKVADLTDCKTDLQLPRYTRIEDESGENVFNRGEIAVTSDSDALKVNSYRVAVDRFFSEEDVHANLIVTFTREGVEVSKKIPVTVKPVTEAEVQDQLNMMEAAKAHYFDGINDGQYADKDSITGNLHAFQEMIFDENGNPKWIYNNDDKTGKGIIPDAMFDNTFEMEAAGYNKFKSSNNAVVAHENLVVNRRETDTQITITSLLSSELYRDAAKAHPDNTLLQKLYKQEVSVTVTIKGTKSAEANLNTQVEELKNLLDSITEGSAPGQYPAGTKDKLQAAIKEAETLLGTEGTTEEAFQAKVNEITSLLKDVQDSQNEEEATVTAKINKEAGKDMDVSKMTVKAHTAANYGYTKPEEYKNKVTVLDVLAAWHAANYGDAFKQNPTDYLKLSNGFINKIYGVETMNIGLLVNNAMPGDATADTAVVKTGDTVTVFRYSETYQDLYLYFEGIPETVKANENISLTLYGYRPAAYPDPDVPAVRPGYTVAALDANGNCVATAVTDEKGTAVLQINTAGTYKITVAETPKDSTETAYVFPEDKITVTASEEHVHSFGKWYTVSAATVFSAAKQERVCKCGKKETRTVGRPLQPTIKVNMTTVSLEVKQTTAKLKVSGLAKGDSVASYKTSNKKIFTVDKNGRLTAGTTEGSATLTITLKSGLKKNIAVKVKHTHSFSKWRTVSAATVFSAAKQERTCKCGKKETRTVGKALKPTIKVNMTTVPLKVKQTTTKLKVSGLAKGDSVASYKTSNKKIFTVDKNGKIKAGKKKGTAKLTITLKSGLKKVVTVKVQKSKVKTGKIQGLTKSMTLKKGTKTTLKPVLQPLTSQQKLEYTSSSGKIATVSSKGVITAKKAGKTTITVKSGSKKFRITVKVK